MDGIQIFSMDDAYIKPQQYNDVTNIENGIWEDLFINVAPLIDQYVSREYLSGIRALPIPKDRFPEFEVISPLIKNSTEWQLVPVAGFLTEELFFDLNANRKFPVTDIIRKSPRFEEKYAGKNIRNDEGYTPEPDIFHDIQGHIPFLMNKAYANFMHDVGMLGDTILKDERGLGSELVAHNLRRLQNFAWWTYEFGLIKNNGDTDSFRRKTNDIDYEIYGAGIISSFDETANVIDCAKGISKRSKILPYDIKEIVMTCFNYSDIQDRYYVIDSMEALYDSFRNNQELFWFEG
jgi:phenylalanine-4-hydroxylase|tara:strand:- start:912 stop:1787 length:876 start_codon:yes stop_codon:yes gene_type:complete